MAFQPVGTAFFPVDRAFDHVIDLFQLGLSELAFIICTATKTFGSGSHFHQTRDVPFFPVDAADLLVADLGNLLPELHSSNQTTTHGVNRGIHLQVIQAHAHPATHTSETTVQTVVHPTKGVHGSAVVHSTQPHV